MNYWTIAKPVGLDLVTGDSMTIRNIFVTKDKDARFCEVCHKQIPKDRSHNAKWCSDKCQEIGRKKYRQKWYQKRKKRLKQEREEKQRAEQKAFAERTGSSEYTDGME